MTIKMWPVVASKTQWDINKRKGMWVGHTGSLAIDIMPATSPYEIATDAFLEFMDKMIEGTYPRAITHADEVMRFCVKRAKRQR